MDKMTFSIATFSNAGVCSEAQSSHVATTEGFRLFSLRLVGRAGGADRGCEPQGEPDGAGGQHRLQPAGGAREDSTGGAAGV